MQASEDIEPIAPSPSENIGPDPTLILGKLARGIAHDINNLVTTIQGNAQLAERALDRPEEISRSLRNVHLACRQITELTSQIQVFSRTRQLPVAPFDFVRVVADIEKLIRSTLPPNICLESTLPNEKIVLQGTASQLGQAVMNLCTNALQAIGPAREGRLAIALSTREGQEARLVIEDNGHGIPADRLARIFDPFFTTKQYGISSGLGLAVVQSVIEAHGGRIEVQSKPDVVTRFEIRLPVDPKAELPEEKSAQAPEASRESCGQAVLLVDDEPTIRGLGVDVLHSFGYRVTVAENGREGLEIVQRKPDYFDLVISDSRMPEMTGLEFAAELRKIRPDIPFILITAFDDAQDDPLFKELDITDVVHKPFRIEELRRSLQLANLKR